jgi:hypothetical protein
VFLASSIPLAVAAIGILGAVLTYGLNERSKRAHEDDSRREDKYWYLISSIRGFYSRSLDRELQKRFILQVSSCWMYCPDEVVRKVYAFIDAVIADGDSSDCHKEQAEGELMATIREDSYGRRFRKKSRLTAPDFRSLWGLERPHG